MRRTFDPNKTWQIAFPSEDYKYGLGDFLDEARKWAQDEIDKIKGRRTQDEIEWAERLSVGRLIRSMTLERAANALLRGLYANGAAERYRDRLDKLFARYVPEQIKTTPLATLNPKQVARALVEANTSPGNVRVLRSFIAQIIEHGASFHGPLGSFRDKFSDEFSAQWERNRDVRYPELRKFNDEKYLELFRILESDDEYWQQAMAIRLYFAFRAPLNRILSAQWKQIHEHYWYPYWPDEKKYWFECRERIDGNTPKLLDRVKRLAARDFNNSQFWFPSNYPRGVDHIRAVEHAWRRALRRSRIRYYPLREFSRSFREFNNPSYYLSFLNEYGAYARKVQNAAEVSKVLTRAKKQ